MTPCRCSVCTADRRAHRLLGFVVGLIVACLLIIGSVHAASRSAPELLDAIRRDGGGSPLAQGQSGAPLSGTARKLDAREQPGRKSESASGAPTPTATVDGPPAPSANRRLTAPKLVGIASYMARSYGRRYLALPGGPGVRVRVCGAADCIVRTSTDAGPDREMQRQGRIVDLSWWDWQTVSGLPPSRGLARVSVEVLRP